MMVKRYQEKRQNRRTGSQQMEFQGNFLIIRHRTVAIVAMIFGWNLSPPR